MIYKGYVVKLEKDFAIVITDSMEYLQIIRKDGLAVGKQILFLKEDLYAVKKPKFIKSTAVAAALVLIICSMMFLSKFQIHDEVFALVSVDINPSIELELNSERRVIRAVPLNSEGKELLTQNLKGLNIEKALDFIFYEAKERHYIQPEENYVFIAVVMMQNHAKIPEEEFSKEIQEKVQKKFQKETNLLYLEGQITKKDLKKARKNEISTGKYEIFKSLEKAGQKVTLEQVKKMNIQEIEEKKMLQQFKRDERKEKKNEKNFPKNNGKKGQPKPTQKAVEQQKMKENLTVVKENKKTEYKERKKNLRGESNESQNKKTDSIHRESKEKQQKENLNKKEKGLNEKAGSTKKEEQSNNDSSAKSKMKKHKDKN